MSTTITPATLLVAVAKAAKAIAATVVVAAAYLTGVLTGDQGLGDVTTLQWLGLIAFLGGAFGITYATPNRKAAPKAVRDDAGSLIYGDTHRDGE